MPMSIDQYRRRMRVLRKQMDKVALPTIRAHNAEVRKDARKQLRATGLGRALWRRRRRPSRSQPPLILRTLRTRLNRSAGAFQGGIKVKGMAAIIEQGGFVASHKIEAVNARFLVFQVGGLTIRTRSVQHPGANVRRRAFVQSGQRKAIPAIERTMRARLNRLYTRIVVA